MHNPQHAASRRLPPRRPAIHPAHMLACLPTATPLQGRGRRGCGGPAGRAAWRDQPCGGTPSRPRFHRLPVGYWRGAGGHAVVWSASSHSDLHMLPATCPSHACRARCRSSYHPHPPALPPFRPPAAASPASTRRGLECRQTRTPATGCSTSAAAMARSPSCCLRAACRYSGGWLGEGCVA